MRPTTPQQNLCPISTPYLILWGVALGTGRSSSISLLTCVHRPSAHWNVTPEGRKSLCPAPGARCPEWSLVQTHAWQMFADDAKGPHLHLLLPVQPHVVNFTELSSSVLWEQSSSLWDYRDSRQGHHCDLCKQTAHLNSNGWASRGRGQLKASELLLDSAVKSTKGVSAWC